MVGGGNDGEYGRKSHNNAQLRKGRGIQTSKGCQGGIPDKEFIFASTTPTNLEWKVQDLIGELKKEHEEFKKMKEQNQENK